MVRGFLGTDYWRNEFAVTDGDLDRLETALQEAGEPLWATRLVRRVVEYKLTRESQELDAAQRARSEQAADRFLGEASVYDPTAQYQIGDQVHVARKRGQWQIGCGRVVGIDRSEHPPAMELEVPGEAKHWKFLFSVPPDHRVALQHSTPLSERQRTADEILEVFSGDLLPVVQGRLRDDSRYVNWGDRWWLRDVAPVVTDDTLEAIYRAFLREGAALSTGRLLAELGANWPDTPGNRFSLNRALAASDRFENVGTEAEPRWRARTPAHWILLPDGTWLDPSLPPDALWARHTALLAGHVPAELRDHAEVIQLYGRWLLRPLLIPFECDELEIVRAFLDEACEPRSDADILAEFGKDPKDGDWVRWRFSLAWALHEDGERLAIEYVGVGDSWRWALRQAPAERPERHRPIRGRDGLPVQVVPIAANDVERELSEVEPDEPTVETGPWEPGAQEWPYTLTYYDWQHGTLPYVSQARAIIPRLAEGQDRAVLYVVAEQVSGAPFAVTLYRHERTPWLHSQGLLELCQGYYLVPGTRIRLLRTERTDLVKLLYTPAAEQTQRMLFFELPHLRPVVREVTFHCDVDPDMLLTESRFSDLEALSELYQADRRTAPKVLADLFEVIGEYDKAPGVFRARFRDLLPLLCVTKPYSHSYVRQILSRSRSYPWFYPDRDRRGDWHCYEPAKSREMPRAVRRKATVAAPTLGEPFSLWRLIAALAGRQLRTLDSGSSFRVLEVHGHVLQIQVGSSGKTRAIERHRFEGAWESLLKQGSLTLAEIRAHFSDWNPVYVAAILAEMPGVMSSSRPIVLRLGATEAPPDPSPPTPAEEKTGSRPAQEAPTAPSAHIPPPAEPPAVQDGTGAPGRAPEAEAGPSPSEPVPQAPPPIPAERRRDGQAVLPGMPLREPFDRPPEVRAEILRASPPGVGSAPAGEPQSPAPPTSAETQSLVMTAGPVMRPRSRRDEPQTKALFSRHYLEHRLPDCPEWSEDARSAFDAVRALWRAARPYRELWNEAQTENDFIRPVLAVLGWAYTPQTKVGGKGNVTRPDYALFESGQVKAEADRYLGQDDPFYTRARAIAEAKYWRRPLSQTDASGRSTWKAGSNPSHQMVSYLAGTRVAWGILTNGQTWRLYSREVSSTASEFYEVDLGAVLDALADDALPSAETLDLFRRWWLFFRREAFLPDSHGKSFVQRVHEGSASYARQISDKLKELVFQQVVPEIAGGLVAYRCQHLGIQQETDESLRQVYSATLNLLYKLLFVLYAEARGLLPMADSSYREQSLTALAEWAADRLDKKLALSDALHATPRYDALLALFRRIDQGDPSLGIPRYDGGLFNPGSDENRFLEQHRLCDRVVARAVDVLVRDAGQPVDYAYISVRNLGAIYEGLLENKLEVRPPRSRQTSEVSVELVNDKGERKASGSYYTPDHIVEYIVEHTLEPILEERGAQFEAAMGRCTELRSKLKHISETAAVGRLRQQLDEGEREAREAFLGIKVCDPAMGSGHFLVNAVDHLTDGIIQRMQAYHDAHPEVPWAWNPIQRLIEQVRKQVLAEMERQGIAADPERLDDTALLTRLVMKRCIYGVDLNPLAVELAKLSLWLHSFTVGAPLSFLDHHLRWGNSLLGTDVRTVEREIQATQNGDAIQLGLWQGTFAGLLDLTAVMTQVAERADASLADVRQSAEEFATFQRQLTPYKQVLDLWVSQHFGNRHAKEFLTLYRDDVLPALRGERQVDEPYRTAIEQARTLWREMRFFHWDLEFPDVYVALHRRDWAENSGFDAVISNPPYADIKGLDKDLTKYLFEAYATTRLRINVFASFLERALQVAMAQGGQVGFIIPTAFLTQVSYADLRKQVLNRCWLSSLVRLPNESFGEAAGAVKVDTCILVIRTGHALPTSMTEILVYDTFERVETISRDTASSRFETQQRRWEDVEDSPIILGKTEDVELVARIRKGAVHLDGLCEFCLGLTPYDKYAGHTEGQITQKVFHAKTQADTTCRKLLQSGDVRRYTVEWNGEDWIRYGGWLAAPREQRFFTEERILVQQIIDWSSRRILAGWTDEELYNTQNQFNLLPRPGTNLRFVLAVLNSRLLSYYHRQVFLDIGLQRFQKVLIKDARTLPIPSVANITPAGERQRRAEKARQIYDQFCARREDSTVLAFVAQHLDAGRSDVVHDMLAFLAEQMIDMHKQKQAHLRAFRQDLAGYLGEKQMARIGRLHTPPRPPQEGTKGFDRKQANYDVAVRLAQGRLGPMAGETLGLDDFWRLGQLQWIGLLRTRLGSVDNMSKLVAVYDQYHSELAPLMRRIERTDRLIDQVVYLLYGLTEEEIAIVEGHARDPKGLGNA